MSSNECAELAARFDSLLTAIAYEIPAIDPAFASSAVAEWKRAAGLESNQPRPAAFIVGMQRMLQEVSEHLGLAQAETSDLWLNSDSPLTCGAFHDLLDWFLEWLAPAQHLHIAKEAVELQTFSRVMGHVAESGESIAQARARVGRQGVGLRLVA